MGVKTPPNTNSTYKHAKQLRMRIRRPLQVHQLLLQGLSKEVIPRRQDAPASRLPAGRRRLYPVTSSPTPPCRTTSSMSSSCSNFKPLADDDLFYLPTEVAVSRGGLRKNCNDIAKKINIIYTSLFTFLLFSHCIQ